MKKVFAFSLLVLLFTVTMNAMTSVMSIDVDIGDPIEMVTTMDIDIDLQTEMIAQTQFIARSMEGITLDYPMVEQYSVIINKENIVSEKVLNHMKLIAYLLDGEQIELNTLKGTTASRSKYRSYTYNVNTEVVGVGLFNRLC